MPITAYKIEDRRHKKKEEIILVESSSGGNVPRNASFDVVERLSKNLKGFGEKLAPLASVAETIRKALAAANNPHRIEVEFGSRDIQITRQKNQDRPDLAGHSQISEPDFTVRRMHCHQ